MRDNQWSLIGLRPTTAAVCLVVGVVLAPNLTLSQVASSSARCFTYDAAGRLVSVRDHTGQNRSFGLDPASNRKAVTSSIAAACAGLGVPAPTNVAQSPPPPPPPPPNSPP
ncbi:MAG: RHS repeat domain-containing protein, partial [Pseudomonadota bacterium]